MCEVWGRGNSLILLNGRTDRVKCERGEIMFAVLLDSKSNTAITAAKISLE